MKKQKIKQITNISEITAWTMQNEGIETIVYDEAALKAGKVVFKNVKQDYWSDYVEWLKSNYSTNTLEFFALEIASSTRKVAEGFDKPIANGVPKDYACPEKDVYEWTYIYDRVWYRDRVTGDIVMYTPSRGWVLVSNVRIRGNVVVWGAYFAARLSFFVAGLRLACEQLCISAPESENAEREKSENAHCCPYCGKSITIEVK